jgi:DNA-binding transcriptional LysR family regulator
MNPMLIDLVQLRTFVAVAEERHLTRAAERLHISRSAASTHIRAVEERLETLLFVRTNRSLALTRAGELLLHEAKTLLHEAAHFGSFARELRGKVDGRLVVGANSEPTNSRIGQIVAALRERHPLIALDLRARHSAGTLQGLKTGELDVGLLSSHPGDTGLACWRLTTVRFRIAGPVAWKERIDSAGWPELSRMPWVASSDDSLIYSSWLQRAFSERGLELNTVVRFDSGVLARALPAAGVGLMLLREEHALQGERDGTLALWPLATAEFPLLLAHVAGRGNDPLIQAFVEAARTAWPQMEAAVASD